MNEIEQKLLEDHRKWFDQLRQFVCVACLRPTNKEDLGKIAIFRPIKKYKLARVATYMICAECKKLPEAEIYQKVEKWLMERGHVEL